LTIGTNSNLTGNRRIDLNTGDADRTITLNGNLVASGTVSGTNTGDQTISLSGDVTATGSTGALSTTIANSAVTTAKMANLAANRILGNSSASPAAPSAITCTAAGFALLDDADAEAQRTTLGLGSMATAATTSYAAVAGGTAASFSNPPLLGTASGSFTSSNQIVNKQYVDNTIANNTGGTVTGGTLALTMVDLKPGQTLFYACGTGGTVTIQTGTAIPGLWSGYGLYVSGTALYRVTFWSQSTTTGSLAITNMNDGTSAYYNTSTARTVATAGYYMVVTRYA
jgi:hypothetical protein